MKMDETDSRKGSEHETSARDERRRKYKSFLRELSRENRGEIDRARDTGEAVDSGGEV